MSVGVVFEVLQAHPTFCFLCVDENVMSWLPAPAAVLPAPAAVFPAPAAVLPLFPPNCLRGGCFYHSNRKETRMSGCGTLPPHLP